MTREEFEARRTEPCHHCGGDLCAGAWPWSRPESRPPWIDHNPNNNGQQVICGTCQSRTPWTLVHYIKQTTKKRRDPLPDGETLDSIWARWGDVCFMCGGPKSALIILGIGRQVHHVLPYADHGHQGPLVPVCTQCHEVATARQRVFWFYYRLSARRDDADESSPDGGAGVPTFGVPRDSVRPAREAPAGVLETVPDDDADE